MGERITANLRGTDIDAPRARFGQAGLPADDRGILHLTEGATPPNAPRMFAPVDLDGSLWRVIDETHGPQST